MSHLAFITIAYGVALIALGGLVVMTSVKHRMRVRQLKLVEALVNNQNES